MDTTERLIVGGAIAFFAGIYLICGAVLARLMVAQDSLFWLAIVIGWPVVLACLALLLAVSVAILSRLFDGGRS